MRGNKMLTHDIHVKTGTYGIQPVIHAVEGETGRFINIYTDDRAVTSSEEAELSIHRPDDSYYTDDHATVMPDSSEGQGFYHFSLVKALTRPGKVDCQLKISNNGLVLSTYTFCIMVEPSTTGLPVEQLGYDIYDLIEAAQQIQNVGLTEEIKQALLDCFEHVAWTDEHGQDYVDALEAALYPPAELVSISAVYTQSGAVYDTASLDDLKPDLVVTAHYDNGTSETVTNYTLSGTLTTGTSTITVSYGGKTTTFTVTVTHAVTQYTITNTLTNCTNSNSATVINELTAYSGTLTADTDYVMGTVTVTMGGTDITSTAYDSSTGGINITSVTGDIVITAVGTEPPITVVSGLPLTLAWNSGNTNLVLSETLGAQGDAYTIELYFTGLVQHESEKLKVSAKGGASNTWLFSVTASNITVTAEQVAEQKIVYSGTLSSVNAGSTALGVAYSGVSGVKLTDVKMYKG